jgi:adenylate cyclase
MGIEIERKFHVKSDDWRQLGEPVHYLQGYLVADTERTVRIRIAGEHAFITIKGPTDGISRKEFEYEIAVADATEMLHLCSLPVVEKYRTKAIWKGKTWEIDEFKGENEGLIMAEIELYSPDEIFENPPWIGEEVTGDMRYFNSWLSRNPYRSWGKSQLK